MPDDHHTDLTQGRRDRDHPEILAALVAWAELDDGDPARWAKWRAQGSEQRYTLRLSSGRRG